MNKNNSTQFREREREREKEREKTERERERVSICSFNCKSLIFFYIMLEFRHNLFVNCGHFPH